MGKAYRETTFLKDMEKIRKGNELLFTNDFGAAEALFESGFKDVPVAQSEDGRVAEKSKVS